MVNSKFYFNNCALKFVFVFLACFISLSTSAQSKILDDDIPIDDVIDHLVSGDVDILKNHKVTLKSIYFKTGQFELTPLEKSYLDSLAEYLLLIPTVDLYVNGYTDNIGQFANNERLSRRRAEIVKSYLVSRGVLASKIQSDGFGQASPIASNKTAKGREANRRVELHFKPNKAGNGKNRPEGDNKLEGENNSTITLNSGEKISAGFFMKSPDSQEVLYKEKLSDKVVKKLRVSEIRSIALSNGVPYDIARLSSSKVMKISPTLPVQYNLTDGTQIKTEVSKIFANGDSLAYKVKRTDSLEKKISVKAIDKAVQLKREDKPSNASSNQSLNSNENTSNKDSLLNNNGKSPSNPLETTNKSESIIDLSKIPRNIDFGSASNYRERMRNAYSTSRSILSKTTIFASIGRLPIKSEYFIGTLQVINNDSVVAAQTITYGDKNAGFGMTLGLENEFGKNKPVYYARLGWNFGFQRYSFFRTYYGGAGKIFGRRRATRLGVDLGSTRCYNSFGEIPIGNNILFDEKVFANKATFAYRNSSITITPNCSYEYVSQNYANRTVRLSFGITFSVPMQSRVILTTDGLEASLPLKSDDVRLIIAGEDKRNFTMAKMLGWHFTFGYVFFK
jgi:outer membrane protein OmpA-like peptidoglycan-associated protein